MADRPGPEPAGSPSAPALRRWTYRIFGLLAVQFVLGMAVNLFGSFPDGVTTLGGTFLYQGDPLLLLHITLAAILLGAALITVLLALSREVPWSARAAVLLAAGGVFGAAVAGYLFVSSGFSDDRDSFAMALGFLLAIVGYGTALPELPRPP
ncbi:MAG TPA: hypothetical protein VMH90_00855 [Thermoplasmata archaeon]|nr:hypothetical protein [Thermoplasmata archaeon]